MKASLERGDGPAAVGLWGVALQGRLEAEAPDRPGEVDGEGQPNEGADATDDRGDQGGDCREHEGADEHHLLAGVAADPRCRGVTDDRSQGSQAEGDTEPRRAGVGLLEFEGDQEHDKSD